MSSSSSPCAVCKFLQLNCTQECVLAPYFPADELRRFSNLDRLFGASNVAKALNMVSPENREYVANALAYETDMCIDPDLAKLLTYEADKGCSGEILALKQENRQLRHLLMVLREAAVVAAAARVFDADPAAYRTVATADAAAASNAAAGVSLGRNVFTPPPLDHHPRQDQQAPVKAASSLQTTPSLVELILAEMERDLPEQK